MYAQKIGRWLTPVNEYKSLSAAIRNGAKLEFGTEIVAAEDGSLAALLGASPGASVSVKTMLEVLERCFPHKMQSTEWQDKIKAMIPSYGHSLINDAELLARVRKHTLTTLKLTS
jgi:Predicted dehydrogenase